MKVLAVSHYVLPHVGGIEVLVDQLGRQLVRAGHEVTVVSSRLGAPARETRDGVRFMRVPAWNVLERRLHVPYPIFAPSLLSTLWREVRAAEVVHIHGLLYLTSWCALLWAWWCRKPVVVTEHVGFVHYQSPWLNWVQRLALAIAAPVFLRAADAVIALNPRVHQWLAGQTPYPERLHFVPNGIDTDRFRPAAGAERELARQRLGLVSARPVALFVGRFVQKKRIDLLLDAADGSFELLLCGPGELPPGPRSVALHVVGNVPHDRMPEVYRAADVFVIPSHGEGFPVAVMEAMASGLPVVAVRDPTYDRYVSDREVIQTDATAERIRAALTRLLSDAEDRRQRAEAARQRALSDFSLASCTARHVVLYHEARGSRELSTALSPLGHDLATRLKIPVLRGLIGESPASPWADVGPGSGYVTHHVFGPGPVIIVDVSLANLQTLRTRARAAGCPDRFRPVRADLAALPFRDGALGTVLCTEVLEHVEDDRRAAAELMRVLAAAGRLVAEVPHSARGYASYLERLGVTTVHDVPGPEYHHRPGYTAESLAALFHPVGGHLTRCRAFVGFVGLFLIDAVAAVHLAYERLRFGRNAWTWADVHQLTSSPVFRLYRLVFPLLHALTWLDALASRGVGFILGARIEKQDSRQLTVDS